jgi:hypothetical protein
MSVQLTVPQAPSAAPPPDPQRQPKEAEQRRVERRRSYGSLSEFLKRTCRMVEEEDGDKWLEILRQQNRCVGFYDDKPYGKWSKSGEWEELKLDEREFAPRDNKYKEQVDKLLMEMARASVDFEVEPADVNDSAKREAAAFIKSRIDANRKRMFIQRPDFVLSEKQALLLKTITFRYTYFDPEAKESAKERRPVFETQAVGEEKSIAVCAGCGRPRGQRPDVGDDQALSAVEGPSPCPACGSPAVRQMQTKPVEVELPVGEKEVKCGLPRTVHVDPTMVKLSLQARMSIESSPYIVWEQTVELGKLERMFPDIAIPTGGSESEAADNKRENETQVSNSGSGGYESAGLVRAGGEQLKKIRLKLVWLDPWVYGDYVDDKRPQALAGYTLQPGRTLLDDFPDGLCVAKVGDTLLRLYSEDKNKKWSMGVYGIREHALHGSGTNALIPIEILYLDLLAYRLANVYYNTNPREFVLQDGIEGGNLPPISKVGIVTNLPDNVNRIVGGVYDKAPGSSLPPEVKEFSMELAGAMQEQAGTSSLSQVGTSAERDALGTATGVAAMRDQAVGRMGPNLMLLTAMEVEHAYQVLECEQANYSKQHLMRLAGLGPEATGNLGFSVEGVEAFIDSDLRADFLITPIPGSWMPTTEMEKKADAVAFADAAQKVEDAETLAALARTFRQPVSAGSGYGATEREAARRLEEFAKVARVMVSGGYTEATDEMAQVILDSATNAALNVEMDNHPAFVNFYRDWWVSDEARVAPPVLKKAVELRVREHKAAMVEGKQKADLLSAVAEIPNKLAQVASGQIDAQAEGQSQQMQAEQQIGLQSAQAEQQLAQQAAETELAMRDREHEAVTDALSREHEAVVKQEAGPRRPE